MKTFFVLITVFSIIFFSCSKEDNNIASFTDLRDGYEYKQVMVGKATWMAEDLRYGTPPYSYQQALFLCPDGWSLPMHDDWANLANAYGGYETYDVEVGDGTKAYQALKSGGSSGFNADGYYWSGTPAWLDAPGIRSFSFSIHEDQTKVTLVGNLIGSTFNCRCVKREKEAPNGSFIQIWVDGIEEKYELFPTYSPEDGNNMGRLFLFLYKKLEENELTNRISIGMEIPSSEIDSDNPYLAQQSGVTIQEFKDDIYKDISIGNLDESYEMTITFFDRQKIEGNFSGLAFGDGGELVEGNFLIFLPEN